MSNIIPFTQGAKLPAYIKQANVEAINADLLAHAGGGFPVISIRGKVFALVRDGERQILPNPKDPDSPATYIEVALLKANKATSKVFYLKGYDPETSEGAKPDCYSSDGERPAADAQKPQAKQCATCPHNQWGSRVTEKGASKGKACSDTVRMAVAPVAQINDAMLLRVPPASIRNLGEYGQMLAKRGLAYNMVVTRVSFDQEAESPRLIFKPVGFLSEEAYAQVQEAVESPIVRDILGSTPMTEPLAQVEAAVVAAEDDDDARPPPKAAAAPTPKAPKARSKVVTDDEVETAVQAAKPTAPPKPAPAPKATPAMAATADDDVELDLDGIDFDD